MRLRGGDVNQASPRCSLHLQHLTHFTDTPATFHSVYSCYSSVLVNAHMKIYCSLIHPPMCLFKCCILDLSLFTYVDCPTDVLSLSDPQWMDAPALGGIKLSLCFEQLAELRAQRHEHLRGRNNVTSCRSPTKEIDTKQIKDQLKERRQQEFLKRRSLSSEPLCPSHSAETLSPSRVYIQKSPVGRGRGMIVPQSCVTDGPSSHRQVTTSPKPSSLTVV